MSRFSFLFAILVFAASLLGGLRPASCSQLFDFQGHPQELSEFIGQGAWTIVMFWASDCHVCNEEIHQYVLFHDEHHSNRAGILGISLDGKARKAQALQFVARHMVDFPNLIGEPDVVARLYSGLTGESWLGTPTFLVFAPDGKLRARQVGAVPATLMERFIERESPGGP